MRHFILKILTIKIKITTLRGGSYIDCRIW